MEHCSHPSSSSMLPVPVVDPLCHSRRNRHLAFSPWSGTPVCSPLVFCKLFCVWRCIPDVSMERDVLHVHLLLHHPHLTFIVVTSSCFLTVSSSKCASFNYGSVLPPLKKTNILPLIMHKFFLHCFLFLSFYCLRKPGHLTAVFPTVWILLAAHSWDSSVRSSALCVRCPWSAGSRGSTDPASVLLTRLYGFLHQLPLCWMFLAVEAQALDPLLHWGANMVTYILFTVLWFTFYCLLILSLHTICK